MKKQKETPIPFENIDYFVDLGNHIFYYRKKKGYTQKELAHYLDISQTFVSRIERQTKITPFSMNLFISICRILDVEPQKMFEPLP